MFAAAKRGSAFVFLSAALVETTPALQRLGKYQPACPAALFLLFPKISQRANALRDFWEEEERNAYASIAALRQCENVADCSDESALSEKRGFRTRRGLL